MSDEEVQQWLKKHNCTVEYLSNGEVKVSLKQNERHWDITRDSLKDAVEATNYSECIVG